MPFEFNLLLTILKWCLLALLYLFFFRVLQSTIRGPRVGVDGVGVSGGASLGQKVLGRQKDAEVPPVASVNSASRVVLIQPPDIAGQELVVTEQLTFGRASSCDVELNDTYLSQVHMRISARGAAMVVEDLGSTNGTYVNNELLETPVRVAAGDQIRIGETVMELR